jgi:hypothetical protein
MATIIASNREVGLLASEDETRRNGKPNKSENPRPLVSWIID